jgi:hypothetical protein
VASPTVGVRGFRQCVATKADGERCKGAAMDGLEVCGPHASAGSAARSHVSVCQGPTKSGRPCRAAAQRGKNFCPAHER